MTAPIEIPVRLAADDTGLVTAIKELAAQLRAVSGPTARAKKEFEGMAGASDKAGRSAEQLSKSLQGLAATDLGGLDRDFKEFAGNVTGASTTLDKAATKAKAAVGGMAKDMHRFAVPQGDFRGLDERFQQFGKNIERFTAAPKNVAQLGQGFGAFKNNLDGTIAASEKVVTATGRARVSVSALASSLQALGGFLIARRLGRFAGEVLDTAEAIGNLSEKTGLASETLSVLAFAGRTANVDIGGLDQAFKKFSTGLVGLAQGSKEAAKAFALVGISAKDVEGLTVDQALAKVIDAFNALPDGVRKSAAATAVFGRAGADLIPLLNEIAGKGGMAGVADEARKAGLIFDRDATAAAKRFKDQMSLLRATLEGAAFEITRGIVPALAGMASGFRQVLSQSPELRRFVGSLGLAIGVFTSLAAVIGTATVAMRLFGITSIAALAPLLGNPIVLAIAGISALAGAIAFAASQTNRATDSYRQYLGTIGDTKALDKQAEALRIRREQLLASIKTEEEAQKKSGTPSDFDRRFNPTRAVAGDRLREFRNNLAFIEEQLRGIESRRKELGQASAFDLDLPVLDAAAKKTKAFRDSELAAEQERLKIEEVQLKDSYDRRLIDVETFFARRRDLLERQAALEVGSLQKELAQAEPDDRPAIEGRIAQRRLQLEREILELRIEQRRESEKLAEEEEKASKERFQSVIDQAQRVQNDVARQRERIQQLIVTGSITERQGEVAIANVERSRLPVLQALADQADRMAESLGPAAVEQAQALRAEIQQMQVNAAIAAREMARLRSTLESDVEGGIASFLKDPTKPLDALRGMLEAVQGTLADFFAKKISDVLFQRGDAAAQLASAGASLAPAGATLTTAGTTLTTAAPALTTSAAALTSSGQILFSAAAALQASAASLAAAQAAGGAVDFAAIGSQLNSMAFAHGGAVPGFGLRDTVPAWLRPGEHVLTPEEVRAAGGHGAVAAWRRALMGGVPPAPPVRMAGVRRFATGGPVLPAAAGAGGEFTLRGEFGLEDGLVFRALDSPEGERVFVKLARRNRKALSNLMPRRK